MSQEWGFGEDVGIEEGMGGRREGVCWQGLGVKEWHEHTVRMSETYRDDGLVGLLEEDKLADGSISTDSG